MEKMIWEKPQMNEVAFAANEYVAACGDPLSTTYKFICTALAGPLYYYKNAEKTEWELLGNSYSPCKETHEVTVEAGGTVPFYEGFVDYTKNGKEDNDEHVAVWIEWGTKNEWVWDSTPGLGDFDWSDNGHYETVTYVDNAHAMTALNTSVIEADRS